MSQSQVSYAPVIVNKSDGPKVAGTRITVYAILELLEYGVGPTLIAQEFELTRDQVQAAIDYINANQREVRSTYQAIMARIAKGNPPELQRKLDESSMRFRRMHEIVLTARKKGTKSPTIADAKIMAEEEYEWEQREREDAVQPDLVLLIP